MNFKDLLGKQILFLMAGWARFYRKGDFRQGNSRDMEYPAPGSDKADSQGLSAGGKQHGFSKYLRCKCI